MTKTTIIRNVTTLDRSEFRVTAEDVFEALKSLHDSEPDAAFTTRDIASAIAGRFRGVPHDRIERSIRVAVSWLCDREVAYVAGHTVKATPAGCVSKPFLYALYPGRSWDKKSGRVARSTCDCDLLNRVFVFR